MTSQGSERGNGCGHRILVVEDDPNASDLTCAILRSRGDSPHAVATVEEALAAIDAEEWCGFVLDQQLPLNARDTKPLITGGERVTVAARRSDPRRAGDGEAHVTPILALTGYPPGSPFVAGLFKRGIDAFVEKDVDDRIEYFTHEIDEMFAKAGRGDHARCAGLARRVPADITSVVTAADERRVRLAMVGTVTRSGRTQIRVNETIREMQDSRFLPLLRLVVARSRDLEAWSSREALGIANSRNVTTYIREAFDGLVPEGFDVVEADRRGNVRLNPQIVVDPVPWDALAAHADPGVVRVAMEQKKRREER